MRFSLRMKGVFSILAVTVLIFVLGTYIAIERSRLYQSFISAEHAQREADANRAAKFALTNALMRVNKELFAVGAEPDVLGLVSDVEPASRALNHLVEFYPEVVPLRAAIDKLVDQAAQSRSRAHMVALRESLQQVLTVTERWMAESVHEHSGATAEYLKRFSTLTVVTAAGALAGLMMFGLMVSVFFGKLGRDIHRLEHRSQEIVKGYRGEPLPIERSDEVGSLIAAVNRMAAELNVRDQQLALAQQQYTHHEKMAAIGALATGVAHEIGNPIAAISGVAQPIVDIMEPWTVSHSRYLLPPRTDPAADRTHRAHYSPDRRFRRAALHGIRSARSQQSGRKHIQFRALRPPLPSGRDQARSGSAPSRCSGGRRLVQVLMNLTINAADALESIQDQQRIVEIGTVLDGDTVLLTVSDNGSGMSPETIARAFEAFFTTKVPGKGTGLGLPMCRALLEKMGANRLESRVGQGMRVARTVPTHEGVGRESKCSNTMVDHRISEAIRASAGRKMVVCRFGCANTDGGLAVPDWAVYKHMGTAEGSRWSKTVSSKEKPSELRSGGMGGRLDALQAGAS